MADIYLCATPFGPDGLECAALVARALGCAALEVSDEVLPPDVGPDGIRGIPVRVLAVLWRPDRRCDLLASLERARHLGVRLVNVYGGLAEGWSAEVAREAFAADVRVAIEGSLGDTTEIALENELAKAPGFAADFDAWAGILRTVGSPRFRGTLDAANFIAAGAPDALSRVVFETLPQIGHVHAKGVMPFDTEIHAREPFRRRWKADGEWLAAPAGEGLPDWTSLLAELIAGGYEGAVTVEPFQEIDMIARAVEAVRRGISAGMLPKGGAR